MLLSLWIAFVALDEVDDWGAPIGVKSQDLLPYGRDQVGLRRGSSSILTVGLLSAWTITPAGTRARLDPSLDRASAATLLSLGT